MGAISPVSIEARYYTREGDAYKCQLCPHGCRIPVGGTGRCGTRRGTEDYLEANTYGRVSSIGYDPVEKKPLYHFHPREKTFSIGSIGCNMRCRHCQNYAISQSYSGKKRSTYKSPEGIVEMCRGEGMELMAFTYNEPTTWIEYILDVKRCAPELKIILVTNGLVNEKPLEDLISVTDAFNIDVKGFTEDFYANICGAHLKDVLRTVKRVFDSGKHLELTYLIIPGHNDSKNEIGEFCDWVLENLSADVPVHFTRFHPDNEMTDVPWTPESTLEWAKETAMDKGMRYVYIGNLMTETGSDTVCPRCGNIAVSRLGYLVDTDGLEGTRCANCGEQLPIIR